MARVIFSIGVPGSGKTTLLSKLTDKLDAAYISPDSIREEIRGRVDDHSDDKEIWRIARARIVENLAVGRDVVFDSTFSRADRRRAFIADARAAGASSIESIIFDVPLEEILRRNASREKFVDPDHIRLSHDMRTQDPPSPADGFDVLVSVDGSGTISDLMPPSGMQLIELIRKH